MKDSPSDEDFLDSVTHVCHVFCQQLEHTQPALSTQWRHASATRIHATSTERACSVTSRSCGTAVWLLALFQGFLAIPS